MLDMTFGTRKARYHHSGLLTTSLRSAEGCGAKGRDLKWFQESGRLKEGWREE